LHPLLLERFGIYQAALLVLIGGCMIGYAAIWRVSATETLASMFAMAAGASIALLALELEYNSGNVVAVVNPLEKMLSFADAKTTNVANGLDLSGILLLLLDGVASVVARYTFVLQPSPRPTVFLTWLIVPGIIYAWRRGERHAAIQALVLLLAAIGIDSLGVRRGLKSEYFIFTDPLIILAAAVLLDSLSDLALSQMDLSPRQCPVRTTYRRRAGRTDKIRLHAQGTGIDMRMEPVLPSAAAVALVQVSPGPAITAC